MKYEPVSVDVILAELLAHPELWSDHEDNEDMVKLGGLLVGETMRRMYDMATALGFVIARQAPEPLNGASDEFMPQSGWHARVVTVEDGQETAFWYGPYKDRDKAGSYGNARAREKWRTGSGSVTYQIFNGYLPASDKRTEKQHWTPEWPDKPRRTCRNCQHTIVNSGGVWVTVETGPDVDGLIECPSTGSETQLHRPLRESGHAEEGQ